MVIQILPGRGSFSVAKSITSLLMGAALKDSSIASLQDPVGKYLPEFSEGEKAKRETASIC